jgi:signal transduction histidine kinase
MATMGEMIGAIAHQWRQPLNVVGLIIQNIQDSYGKGRLDTDSMDKMVRKAMTQIEHMSKTIDDFRNFMKPDRNKAVFDTMRAAGNVLGLLSAQLSANGIVCRFSCRTHGKTFEDPEDAAVCPENTVEGYKNEFEHVILNLISNSRDAIIEKRKRGGIAKSEKGFISLDFFNADGKVNIEVSDNGGGIRPEDIDRIFEPYFTTKEPTKGTGLGLYISKVIVKEHMNGSLTTKNSDGGATFCLVLPQHSRGDAL